MSDSSISVPRVPWHDSRCSFCDGEEDIYVVDRAGKLARVSCPHCGGGGVISLSDARQLYFMTTGEAPPPP